jgi:hypothetical protein
VKGLGPPGVVQGAGQGSLTTGTRSGPWAATEEHSEKFLNGTKPTDLFENKGSGWTNRGNKATVCTLSRSQTGGGGPGWELLPSASVTVLAFL